MGKHSKYLELLGRWYQSEPVCGDDCKSQIEWLDKNATPALLYHSLARWNWDWGKKVLQWMLENPRSSFSTVSRQFVFFVGSGALRYENSDATLMGEVASRLRGGFYNENWGLAPDCQISERDKELYFQGIGYSKVPERWKVPARSFGPFSNTVPKLAQHEFDDDGRLRLAFHVWRTMQN